MNNKELYDAANGYAFDLDSGDLNTNRDTFIAGAKWMIDKACEWLNNFYNEDRHCFLVKEDIEAFERAMMEE